MYKGEQKYSDPCKHKQTQKATRTNAMIRNTSTQTYTHIDNNINRKDAKTKLDAKKCKKTHTDKETHIQTEILDFTSKEQAQSHMHQYLQM